MILPKFLFIVDFAEAIFAASIRFYFCISIIAYLIFWLSDFFASVKKCDMSIRAIKLPEY